LPAKASLCRKSDGNLICILEIKRSAKYYWQYRASVSINGKVKPIKTYNCREQIKIQKNGKIVPFSSNGAGQLICNILNK
jgi:hypothetical protein